MGFSNLWFKGTEESSTYYIKTKNGTLGILQINRLKDYPRSVEFRYKLLQTATPKDEKPDGTGGIHTDVGARKINCRRCSPIQYPSRMGPDWQRSAAADGG